MLLLGAIYAGRRRISAVVGDALREWRADQEERHLLRYHDAPAPVAEHTVAPPVPSARPEPEDPAESLPAPPVPSAMGYAISMAALRGMGLTGPGAPDVARAILVELLTESALPVEVVMPHGLARSLLRDADACQVPGLVVLDSVRDVVTHVEVEIVRRSGTGRNLGRPHDLPWLFVITTAGAMADALRDAIEAGAEYLVLGLVLDDWPSGITCTVDAEGLITDLRGPDAPAWTGHRLPTLALDQALTLLTRAKEGP